MRQLEESRYAPVGDFPLPDRCWLDNFYRPLASRFDAFLSRHGHSTAAGAVVETERVEISLYERYSAYFGYGFYIACKAMDRARHQARNAACREEQDAVANRQIS